MRAYSIDLAIRLPIHAVILLPNFWPVCLSVVVKEFTHVYYIEKCTCHDFPVVTKREYNVSLMLAHRRRRWSSIKLTLWSRIAFYGIHVAYNKMPLCVFFEDNGETCGWFQVWSALLNTLNAPQRPVEHDRLFNKGPRDKA